MTRREFGPCGTTMDRGSPQLVSHPGRYFPYFNDVKPEVVEALLVPFSIGDVPSGTIWVVLHDGERKFDAEDARVLTSMASFAGAGYTLLLSVNRAIAQAAANNLTPAAPMVPPSDEQLTDREREVMSLMVRGTAQKQIGFELGISIKTVTTHRARLMKKLKVHGSFDLLRYALSHGLVNWSEVH